MKLFRSRGVLLASSILSLSTLALFALTQDVPVFRADVGVVNIFFNVKDKHGALIPNLTKDDFQLFEDGKPQTIKYFRLAADQPLTLGMLIDTSASQERVLEEEKDAGSQFLRQTLQKNDLAFVISFDVNVDLLQDFTNSTHDLNDALVRTKINAGGNSPIAGPMGGQGPVPVSNPRGTLLYDAIYLASNEKLANEVGRKAMIVLTDGQDQGSREKIADAIEAAHKADAMCYVILIADRGFYGGFGMGYSGDRDMRKLAEETGGRVIDVGNNAKKLREAFDQISNELRTQYNIGYTSTNTKRDGTFRKIQIKPIKNDYKVQARAGYYATK
jgi:VWFA-related protein